MRKIALLMLLLVLTTPVYAVPLCGNGKCEAGENCYSCSVDCGLCNGVYCTYDNECTSNICCENSCQNSCVAYPARGAEPAIGWFKVGYATQDAIIMALIIIAVGSLFVILKKTKRL